MLILFLVLGLGGVWYVMFVSAGIFNFVTRDTPADEREKKAQTLSVIVVAVIMLALFAGCSALMK